MELASLNTDPAAPASSKPADTASSPGTTASVLASSTTSASSTSTTTTPATSEPSKQQINLQIQKQQQQVNDVVIRRFTIGSGNLELYIYVGLPGMGKREEIMQKLGPNFTLQRRRQKYICKQDQSILVNEKSYQALKQQDISKEPLTITYDTSAKKDPLYILKKVADKMEKGISPLLVDVTEESEVIAIIQLALKITGYTVHLVVYDGTKIIQSDKYKQKLTQLQTTLHKKFHQPKKGQKLPEILTKTQFKKLKVQKPEYEQFIRGTKQRTLNSPPPPPTLPPPPPTSPPSASLKDRIFSFFSPKTNTSSTKSNTSGYTTTPPNNTSGNTTTPPNNTSGNTTTTQFMTNPLSKSRQQQVKILFQKQTQYGARTKQELEQLIKYGESLVVPEGVQKEGLQNKKKKLNQALQKFVQASKAANAAVDGVTPLLLQSTGGKQKGNQLAVAVFGQGQGKRGQGQRNQGKGDLTLPTKQLIGGGGVIPECQHFFDFIIKWEQEKKVKITGEKFKPDDTFLQALASHFNIILEGDTKNKIEKLQKEILKKIRKCHTDKTSTQNKQYIQFYTEVSQLLNAIFTILKQYLNQGAPDVAVGRELIGKTLSTTLEETENNELVLFPFLDASSFIFKYKVGKVTVDANNNKIISGYVPNSEDGLKPTRRPLISLKLFKDYLQAEENILGKIIETPKRENDIVFNKIVAIHRTNKTVFTCGYITRSSDEEFPIRVEMGQNYKDFSTYGLQEGILLIYKLFKIGFGGVTQKQQTERKQKQQGGGGVGGGQTQQGGVGGGANKQDIHSLTDPTLSPPPLHPPAILSPTPAVIKTQTQQQKKKRQMEAAAKITTEGLHSDQRKFIKTYTLSKFEPKPENVKERVHEQSTDYEFLDNQQLQDLLKEFENFERNLGLTHNPVNERKADGYKVRISTIKKIIQERKNKQKQSGQGGGGLNVGSVSGETTQQSSVGVVTPSQGRVRTQRQQFTSTSIPQGQQAQQKPKSKQQQLAAVAAGGGGGESGGVGGAVGKQQLPTPPSIIPPPPPQQHSTGLVKIKLKDIKERDRKQVKQINQTEYKDVVTVRSNKSKVTRLKNKDRDNKALELLLVRLNAKQAQFTKK